MDNWLQWGITTLVGILAMFAGRYWGMHDRQIKHDEHIFIKILRIMPSNGTVLFLRSHDFGESFHYDDLRNLHDFLNLSNQPEYCFVDQKLENIRKLLISNSENFLIFLGMNVWPLDNTTERKYKIKSQDEFDSDEKYHSHVKKINKMADDICESYDKLIEAATKKLSPNIQ